MGTSELALRLSGIRAGVRITLALAVAGAAYLAATPHGPHRVLLGAIMLLAAADAAIVTRLPHERIARVERHHDLLLCGWTLAHTVVAMVACLLDGGAQSPFRTIFFVSVAYAAVSLPPRRVVIVAAADVAALAAVAGISGAWNPCLIFVLPALAVTASVCTAIAHVRSQRTTELQLANEDVVERMARVIEYRDNETGEHTERMSAYCGVIARRLGWSEADARELELAATMHDVGKVAVPDAVLLKPGPLTPAERAVMQRHTVVGHAMLSGSRSELIELAATIALTHHERVDGQGYPYGHCADAIPLAGRIVAVADVFDALTSDRVYRPAMSVADAIRIMRDGRGTQFDARVFDTFEDGLDEILAIRSRTIPDVEPAELVAA
jgi:hypothetical protein